MVKHVLNYVPVYQMGTFKLPNKLTSIERRFFWGYNTARGMNPIGWKKVCKPKDQGGLAFRDLEKLNLALLTKLAWRICTENENLMVQVLRGKYFNGGDILHKKFEAIIFSYTWNGITQGISILQQNVFMEVNNGSKTRIWADKWIPGMTEPPTPINELFRFYEFVSELFMPDSNLWNVNFTKSII
ncbi:uncharacterized protein LOC113280645 [Papaver somniferum]|uniref:uncharacterized protein LOC113280645 n=1 Tax=Papaver somniferum TaxID=3469 RepID=UPI000E6FE780|nr:uncharacterized protein LOC113280645 [Papaver somniferum]